MKIIPEEEIKTRAETISPQTSAFFVFTKYRKESNLCNVSDQIL